MIHTSQAWDPRVIHEIHEERKEILAIPHREHVAITVAVTPIPHLLS